MCAGQISSTALVPLPAGGSNSADRRMARPQEGHGEGAMLEPGRDRRSAPRSSPAKRRSLCPRRRSPLRPALTLSVARWRRRPGALDQAAPAAADGSSIPPSTRCAASSKPASAPSRQARNTSAACCASHEDPLTGTPSGGRGARRGEAAPDRLRCRQALCCWPASRGGPCISTCRELSAPAPALRQAATRSDSFYAHPCWHRRGRPWLRPPAFPARHIT